MKFEQHINRGPWTTKRLVKLWKVKRSVIGNYTVVKMTYSLY